MPMSIINCGQLLLMIIYLQLTEALGTKSSKENRN